MRAALGSSSTHLTSEGGIDLAAAGLLFDAGDLDPGENGRDFASAERAVGELIANGARVLAIGGDHAVTLPLVRAHHSRYPGLSILQLDAHPDLYDEFGGDRRSHASVCARILEQGLAARLVQAGIRAMNAEQRAQAERFGVEVIEMRDWRRTAELSFDGPVYLTLDLDVLDPAFAPGVSHWEPGGATTRQVIDLVRGLEGDIVGADVVELNPSRDPHGVSAATAARLAREIAGRMLEPG